MTAAGDWDQRYAAAEQLFSGDPDAELVEFASAFAPGRAVDLGAGEGRNALWLARHGWRVVAVDISGVALARLQATAEAEGLQLTTVQAGMAEFLARGERFDLVVLAYIQPAPAERGALLAAAAAAVATGGHLFLIGHHLDSLGVAGPSDPDRLYTEERLSGAFPGLELLRLERRIHRRGAHGARHTHGQDANDAPMVDVVVWAGR